MSDLEITRLCADALLPNVWAHGEWNPLHNDAQAMALVKRFGLASEEVFDPTGGHWSWRVCKRDVSGDTFATQKANLNRAICECVAKMQASK